MKLREFTKITQVEVFKDQTLAGTLRRTANGSIFEYDSAFYQHVIDNGHPGLSTSINLDRKTFTTIGDNLHPFFAGLLPEGARLTALQRSVKTSASDLFSLLLASGEDLIGDVWVSPGGQRQQKKVITKIDQPLKKISFHELFQESIKSDLYESRQIDPSIPGVQPKVSAGMISFPVNIARRNKRYILKLSPKEYPLLVENEHSFMSLAKLCGLEVANTQLVKDGAGAVGLLVERFDRAYDKPQKRIQRLQQEDICQILGRYPADKYRLTMRDAFRGVATHVTAPIVEVSKLLNLVAFSYLIGNGDLHAKNISIIRSTLTSELVLAPGYDILSTVPYGDNKMALQTEGKDSNLTIKEFVALGHRHGVPEKAVLNQIRLLKKRIGDHLSPAIAAIKLPQKKQSLLERTIRRRINNF